MSPALGQKSRIRRRSRRPVEMMRAGACQSCQRSRFGRARAKGPVVHSSWNQRTRSAARQTTWRFARFAANAVNGNRWFQTGVFESPNVVFDVGMGSHVAVQLGGVAVLVKPCSLDAARALGRG